MSKPSGAMSSGVSYVLQGQALWLSFAAATTGTLMVNLDATVVNVALPVMQHEFGLPVSLLQWVVTAYLLVITGVLPLTAQVADWLGRSRLFTLGLLGFALGSVAAALAPSLPALLAARVLQGLGGAVIQANVMAIVALTFPQEQRGRGLGLIAAVVAAGNLLGPPLGGVLTAFFGWRSIFWVNVPVGAWGVWASWRYLPRFARDVSLRPASFDWSGSLLFFAGATSLEFGLAALPSPSSLLLLSVTALLGYVFVRREATAQRPVMPLRLFRIPPFWRNLVSGLAYWVLMMAPSFLLPFYLRVVLREPMAIVGISIAPQALVMILLAPIGGRIADRIGVMLPGRLGLGTFAAADLLFALWPGGPPLWGVWLLTGLIGAGAGLFNAPNNTAVLNSVRTADTGTASGILATQRNLGRILGVAAAAMGLSLYWLLALGILNPSHTSPAYPHLFLAAFRAVFLVMPLFAVLGILTVTSPVNPGVAESEAAAGKSR